MISWLSDAKAPVHAKTGVTGFIEGVGDWKNGAPLCRWFRRFDNRFVTVFKSIREATLGDLKTSYSSIPFRKGISSLKAHFFSLSVSGLTGDPRQGFEAHPAQSQSGPDWRVPGDPNPAWREPQPRGCRDLVPWRADFLRDRNQPRLSPAVMRLENRHMESGTLQGEWRTGGSLFWLCMHITYINY